MTKLFDYKNWVVVIMTIFGITPLVGHANELVVTDTIFVDCPFVRFVNDVDSFVLTDEQFLDAAGQVVFPVNKYQLPPNDPLLKKLEGDILPTINSKGLELLSIMIRGAASPEGPTEFNKRLGERRAAALVDFVSKRLTVPVSQQNFKLDIDFEDYNTLCVFLLRAHDPNYAYVKELCDRYLPENRFDELKSALQKAEGGRLWKHLLVNYFPNLRAARIMLVFRRQQEPAPTVETPREPLVVEAPQQEPTIEVVETPQPEVTASAATVIDEILAEKKPRREFLSVKTNLLFDVAYMPGYNRWCPIPNVAIEYYPKKGHFTFGASIDFPWWQDYDAHKYFQVRNYQLEARYYLRSGSLAANPPGEGAAFRGFYFQGYVNTGLFGICFDADRGWEGEGLGGGLGLGYVLPLSKKGHWRLEFGLQVGYFRCKYDPYQYENPVDPTFRDHLYYYKWTLAPDLFKKRQYRYNWIGPTRIGVTLTYDLLYRRIQKKGISFKSYE